MQLPRRADRQGTRGSCVARGPLGWTLPPGYTRAVDLECGVVDELRQRLLGWYELHRRDLPWRRGADAYAVWVSEVMLQQTRVSVVVDYFLRWMDRFPTLEALAGASEDDVLHAWQGLGYYSRARRLREGAQYVCREHGGELPREVSALLAIPGIGPYSAGAIASIAHGVRAPIVDGNVVRVLCRLFALQGDPTRSALNRTLWQLAGELVPADRPADFNQAMMELGATLCTPRSPKCSVCPVAARCAALQRDLVDQLPQTPTRAPATEVTSAAAVVGRAGRWLVVQLPAHAPRWPGMWTFPTADLAPGEGAADGARRAARELAGVRALPKSELSRVRHQVTRFRITLHAILCDAERGKAQPAAAAAVAWRRAEELAGLAMPAAQRRLASALTARPPSSGRSRR